ncbi:MAG: lamin tail domain-containing protein, partial [Myxococcales bacterium]|nr:lamin tail domain-containing protein [Myxococcales bacterium]
TELLADPHDPLDDLNAEYLEIRNTTGDTLNLEGCVLVDGTPENAEILPVLLLPAGAVAVFAKSNDPALNGGIQNVAYEFGFGLNNGGDQLSLTCGEVIIDALDYAANAEQRPARYIAAQRDEAGRWCAADNIYFGEGATAHYGTPGAANAACPGIARCNLQWPPQIEGEPDSVVTVYGRVVVPGITDRNAAGNDVDDRVRGRLVVGPRGDVLGAASARIAAEPNPGWAGEDPAADEYQVALTLPAPGLYGYAYEFTADGGRTWLACDLDGGENGYQPEQAGQLTSRAVGDPCDPNPCDAPPAARCDADTGERVTYPAVGACENDQGVPACTYAEQREACPMGEICAQGACIPEGARAPAAGEVIFTELMYDPHGAVLLEPGAEWFEIHNTTEEPLDLNGCVAAKGAETAPLDGIILAAGGFAVLTQGGADVNGGIQPDGAFAFALTNGGTSLAIRCGDLEIDALTYDDAAPWPIDAQRHTISLDPQAYTAAGNDDGGNWCYGRAAYWMNDADASDDHHGTPGAANPPCDEAVDFCRLQFPQDAQAFVGQPITAGGRIYEEGTTDRTPRTDARQPIVAQFGFGPDGSLPGMDVDGLWTWVDADASAEYDGNGEFGEPNNDEYVATVMAPAAGVYDHAFRFSADGGRTWTYCDGGDAGSSDGYDPANAGALTVVVDGDPCDPNPCDVAPAADCADEATRRTYTAPGNCVNNAGLAECSYDAVLEACPEGESCVAGACGVVARGPAAGEVLITELLADPHDPLADGTAEWFELYNPTAEALSLEGCSISDSANTEPLPALRIEPGAYLVFAQSDDAAVNGGLEAVAYVFGFGLNNNGDTISLTCGDVTVDSVDYGAAGFAAPQRRQTTQRDADGRWCLATDVYFGEADGAHRGTPGAANNACPVIAECRLQWPASIDDVEGAEVTVYGRVSVPGITDLTAGNDLDARLLGRLAVGDPADPLGALAVRIPAAPNAGWDGAEAGFDEYQVALTLPAPGLAAYAFEFSVDGGASWTACDLDGSANGFQVEQAGQATVRAAGDPCDPNPCVDPPVATCDAATGERITYPAEGACAAVDGLPECSYAEQREACPQGEICDAGACVPEGLRAPVAGEVIFTELMYDPHGAVLLEDNAEWVELHNRSADALDLTGCVLAKGAQTSPLDGLIMAPGAFAAITRAGADLNGGIEPALTFNLALTNGGTSLAVRCGADDIDVLTYDDAAPWPLDAQRHSIALDPDAYDAAANDDGANWCYGRAAYWMNDADATDDHHGTPGAANPPCAEAVDFCRLQFPLAAQAAPGEALLVGGRIYEEGTTDRTTGTDARQPIVAEFGFGPDGSLPADDAAGAWTWFPAAPNADYDGAAAGEPNNDEYTTSVNAPAAGLYDHAFRFSADGGRTWTYCDGGDAGSSDGYDAASAG